MESTIRAMFAPASGTTYLDTATYGLPPEPTRRVLADALDAWSAGTASWQDDWDREGEKARAAFAAIIGVEASRVALISSTSTGVGVIAAGLSAADSVVVPGDDFTSILFPLLVARDRGVAVREVAFDSLVDAITPGTTLVATSFVQMQTGRTAPIAQIVERAREVGARVLLDVSQGVPLVPLGALVNEIDYIVGCGYKHLLCPRGVAFMALRSEHIGALAPILANWRSADRPYERFFGGPLTLAPDAAMYDISLAWFPWLGAATSLGLLAEWQRSGVLAGPLELARNLAEGLGVPFGGSSLVVMPIDDPAAARAALAAAGIRASFRGTGIRLSTHVYNDAEDIERAVAALRPVVAR